ncbi:hypothetical protein G6L46_16330 [Agrobacterium rhizogenes]|uniref:hypothetical protein n=1 Tax=Rhizobium rhizogenes TaxID=359 RepID=UPI0015746EA5|nr:hypothetical protein [Rhizobium rhizogenes]NTF88698.1 hypothetical protein [Rhizobium rhizogenes]
MTKKKYGSSLSFKTLERGRFHYIVRQSVWEDGAFVKRPILWLAIPDDTGVRIIRYQPLLDYYAEHAAMSYKWMHNAARAMGTLVDHSLAAAASPDYQIWKAEGVLQRRLLRGLARSLVYGTMKLAPNGRIVDVTKLYWSGLGKRQAKVLLSALTLHFRWLRDDPSAASWVQVAATDVTASGPSVALGLAMELATRKQNSFLGHLKGMKKDPAHTLPGVIRRSTKVIDAVPAFPAKYVAPFLYRSFIDAASDGDEAAQIVAHLIFALGIRASEAFHLYATDIQFIGEKAYIFFHHPESGKILKAGDEISRTDYLRDFGYIPRNLADGTPFKAGWKGMAGDEAGTPGFFLPIASLQRRTAMLLRRYLLVVRPAIMARRPASAKDHPFLLVSARRHDTLDGVGVGDPYTMSAFDFSWSQAIKRVGERYDDPDMLVPDKPRGTTRHGGRHFFGRFLHSLGLEGPIIQRCMHHSSLKAHHVYTRLTAFEINHLLQEVMEQPSSPKSKFRDMQTAFMAQFEDPEFFTQRH